MAFINSSGLDLVYPALVDAVETRGAQLRLPTSGYLDVTDPQALRRLMLLAERGADLGMSRREQQSFHLKVYICTEAAAGSRCVARSSSAPATSAARR